MGKVCPFVLLLTTVSVCGRFVIILIKNYCLSETALLFEVEKENYIIYNSQ